MDCNTCGATFERYSAEWSNEPTGLKLRCPECDDLLSIYELKDSPEPEALPVS
jgi:hypothetical protein